MTKDNPPTKLPGAAPKRVNLEELKKEMLENLADPDVAKAVDAAEDELAEEMRKATLRAHEARANAKRPAEAVPKRVNLEELKKQMLENLNDSEVKKAVDAERAELGDAMQKAASRAHQARVEAKKRRPPAR